MQKLTFEEMKNMKVIKLPADKVIVPMEEAVIFAKNNLKRDEITPDELISFTFSLTFNTIKDISTPSENVFAINVKNDSTYTHLVYNKDNIIADEYFYNEEEAQLEWYSRCEVSLQEKSTFQLDWSYSDSFIQHLNETNGELVHHINTILKTNTLVSLDYYAKKQRFSKQIILIT